MVDDCDCLDGDAGAGCESEDVAPDAHENRPGLSALAYRRGTWASIFSRLRARLPSPLQGTEEAGDARDLNTTASDDPAVALLDAFSVVADVLTFYQERIANEGFLRSATERRSVGYLANSIGYRLSPGVAAGVDLVFSVDESDKAPGVATVPQGTQVLHIPGQDEIPQAFETSEELVAYADWNKLAVPTTCAQVLLAGQDPLTGEACSIDLLGVATGLRQHSRILIVYGDFAPNGDPPPFRLHRLKSVMLDSKRGVTRVTWAREQSLGRLPSGRLAAGLQPKVYALRTTTALFGWNAPDWHALPEAIQKTFLLEGETDAADWPLFNVLPSLAGTRADGRFVTDQVAAIDLAQEHPEIEPDSLVVIADVSGTRSDPAHAGATLAELYRVDETVRVFRQNFRITGHATRLYPSHGARLEHFGLRESAVYAASELLTLAPVDDTSLVGPDTIEVSAQVELPRGRRVLVCGWPASADPATPKTVEAAVVESCDYHAASKRTFIRFAPEDLLSQKFQRAECALYANVVAATHGKTIRDEVLGSGDGSIPFPAFVLKQRPVTHVSDPMVEEGAASTLSVRVNGVAWEQVRSLVGQESRAHVYTTSIDDDGVMTLVFGDGRTGSRLPSGAENLTATYRIGTGKVGEVGAESIALMVKKPLGMRSVLNLEPASGAEDPETSATARANAPASVLVLGRVVSVSDYADFARGFLGVGKAAVSVLWDGDRQVVHLTVTDTSGSAFDSDAEVFENLRTALLAWGDAEVPLVVATLDAQADRRPAGPRRFGLAARLLIDAAYVREEVIAAARALLEARFSAAARDLGQHVAAAEVIAVLHEVDGVIAVDIDELHLLGVGPSTLLRTGLNRLDSCVPAFPARVEGRMRVLRPAELLIIEPTAIVLSEMLP